MQMYIVIYLNNMLHVCVHFVEQLYDVVLTCVSSFKTYVQIFVLILQTCYSQKWEFTNYL